jgi:hypothetical protein
MSYDGNIISAPVSIDDVKQALGESSNDLATLCKSSNIMVVSRYKPVRCYYKNFVDDTVNSDKSTWTEKTSGKGWWLGDVRNTNAAYDYTVVTDIDQAKQLGTWKYQPPTGTSSYPYRLTDFIGYCSGNDGDNMFPFYVKCSPTTVYTNSIITITFYNGGEADYPNYIITADDVFNMLSQTMGDKNHLYIGLYIINETTKKASIVSCTKPMGSLDIQRNGSYFLEMKYDLGQAELVDNEDDSDMYEYGSMVSVSAGDIFTIVPMIYSTSSMFENNATFTPGIVFPKFPITNFENGVTSWYINNQSSKPVTQVTRKFTVSDLKITKSTQTVYWGRGDNNSFVIRSSQMLTVSFTIDSVITGHNCKIKLIAKGNDSDGHYISTKEYLIGTYSAAAKSFTTTSFTSQGYANYSYADNDSTTMDSYYGIPIGVTLMQDANTTLDYITQWDVYIQITADAFYDNNNNYVWKIEYTGDADSDGLIYSETY